MNPTANPIIPLARPNQINPERGVSPVEGSRMETRTSKPPENQFPISAIICAVVGVVETSFVNKKKMGLVYRFER
jgi:hypothetical protein